MSEYRPGDPVRVMTKDEDSSPNGVPLFIEPHVIWAPAATHLAPGDSIRAWAKHGKLGTIVAVKGDRLLCVFEGKLGWTSTKYVENISPATSP